jgi:hypothetical protein
LEGSPKACGNSHTIPLLPTATSLVAFNRTNCRIDRSLQKVQPVADNHFSVAITLPFVIEFLSYIGVGVGSLATGYRLRTEQRRCWQRNWRPFNGANCLIDRALQKLQPAADNHFSVTKTLPFVIELLTLIGIGSGSLILAAFFIPLGGSPRGFRADVLRFLSTLSSTLGISERATNSARTLATVLSLSPTASPICTSVCCGSALSVSLSGVKFSGFRTVRHRRGIASLGIAAKQRNALFQGIKMWLEALN